ncbi:hypothetical protein [Patiriisocius hiemis]|uniref:Uncharacterized protein n=1 Tax=Patiriisocius hiemis TaxID=3075604 RepID=A0ABU2YC23_9FLAO|nr:hypothetical protein [Constantimarinum sp. W242]MDT0555302.1 hypothetical protein [Constantimarinum sp. W242]
MGLHKVFKIIALILGIVGVAFFVNLLVTGNDTITETGEGVDGFMYLTYAILALIVFVVLLFVLKGIFAGNIKKTLFVLLGFVAIIAISYGLASGVETPLKDGGMLSASGSKWVGTGLYAFYIMALLAIAAMVWTGVSKLINR